MKGIRFSLFSKIMLWFFLNLILLAAGLWFVFNLSFRFDYSFFSGNKFDAVSRALEDEVNGRSREERDEILNRYSESYTVEFFLFDNLGGQLGGRRIDLPTEVANEILAEPPRRPLAGPAPGPPPVGRPGGPPFSIFVKTSDPIKYWGGTRIMFSDGAHPEPVRARVIAVSDSMFGNGLFFDPTPWIIVIGIVIVGSILFWLPFVRSMTKAVGQMRNATERIALEDFDVRVDQDRSDELGRLGTGINHLAQRLSGFVTGQKRFLGDISHELNSPLARMNFALGILEDRVNKDNLEYIADVKEEAMLMSKLVGELLAYSKAGIIAPDIKRELVDLKQLTERVVRHESAIDNVDVRIDIDDGVTVLANSELLSRALGNVLRNAVRYAGDAGQINISAVRKGDADVKITIADHGAGVPDALIEKIFDPFFRIESDRSRETGGTGLGMAIVKTCVEACGGNVSAKNLTPSGLEIAIFLSAGVR